MMSNLNVDGWLPIETAPKDGSKVLLWTDSTLDPYWCDCVGRREVEHFQTVQTAWWNLDDGWEKELVGQPTHWMPLPPPPSA